MPGTPCHECRCQGGRDGLGRVGPARPRGHECSMHDFYPIRIPLPPVTALGRVHQNRAGEGNEGPGNRISAAGSVWHGSGRAGGARGVAGGVGAPWRALLELGSFSSSPWNPKAFLVLTLSSSSGVFGILGERGHQTQPLLGSGTPKPSWCPPTAPAVAFWGPGFWRPSLWTPKTFLVPPHSSSLKIQWGILGTWILGEGGIKLSLLLTLDPQNLPGADPSGFLGCNISLRWNVLKCVYIG